METKTFINMWDLDKARREKNLGFRFVTLGNQNINDIEYSIINDTKTSVCYLQVLSPKLYAVGTSITPMYNSDGSLYIVNL